METHILSAYLPKGIYIHMCTFHICLLLLMQHNCVKCRSSEFYIALWPEISNFFDIGRFPSAKVLFIFFSATLNGILYLLYPEQRILNLRQNL